MFSWYFEKFCKILDFCLLLEWRNLTIHLNLWMNLSMFSPVKLTVLLQSTSTKGKRGSLANIVNFEYFGNFGYFSQDSIRLHMVDIIIIMAFKHLIHLIYIYDRILLHSIWINQKIILGLSFNCWRRTWQESFHCCYIVFSNFYSIWMYSAQGWANTTRYGVTIKGIRQRWKAYNKFD